jgi:branched-chain amino acid transport system substrate-binding protein
MTIAAGSVPIGLLISTSGPYATIGRELRDGALLAIEDVNKRRSGGLSLAARIVDPGGSLEGYRAGAEELFRGGVKHIVGCYTSSSRKEIIPIVEKFDGMLWYPSHYEGFESCPNVIYTGAAPNQHVVPLVRWALPRYGRRVYCVGSNYIWAWENTRILRDLVHADGGMILRERYLPVETTDIRAVIDEIAEYKPDFVFNTLIGESSYAFYRAYHKLGLRDGRFLPAECPILSCSLSEPELEAIGPEAAAGHIASSVYFGSIGHAANLAFIKAFQDRFGAGRVTSADSEAAYVAVKLLATSLCAAKDDSLRAVKQAAYRHPVSAPQGEVWIDAENNHAWLTPRIGMATPEGAFAIQWAADRPCRPDPYLAFQPADGQLSAAGAGQKEPHLRVVRWP